MSQAMRNNDNGGDILIFKHYVSKKRKFEGCEVWKIGSHLDAGNDPIIKANHQAFHLAMKQLERFSPEEYTMHPNPKSAYKVHMSMEEIVKFFEERNWKKS